MERLTEHDLDCGYYVDESFVDKVIYSNINNSRGIQGDAIDRLAEYENREKGCEYCDERNMPLWWNNAGHPQYEDQIGVVNKTLQEFKAFEKPILTIFNKMALYEEKNFDEWLEDEVKQEILLESLS